VLEPVACPGSVKLDLALVEADRVTSRCMGRALAPTRSTASCYDAVGEPRGLPRAPRAPRRPAR
jgi:hypothetical protein